MLTKMAPESQDIASRVVCMEKKYCDASGSSETVKYNPGSVSYRSMTSKVCQMTKHCSQVCKTMRKKGRSTVEITHFRK